MNRYSNAIDTLAAVHERCDALVEGLKTPKRIEKEPSRGIDSRRNSGDGDGFPFFQMTERKRIYVDDDIQTLLPDVVEDFKYIGNKDVKNVLHEFIVEYERLVKHERELDEDRDIALRDLHKQVQKVGENVDRNIVFTDFDILRDDVGNPQLHKELDIAEIKFIDYCGVEHTMKGIGGQLTELKGAIHNGNATRLKHMKNISTENKKHYNRLPTDICNLHLHKLKKVVFLALDKPNRALTLQNALNDLEVVEHSFAGLQVETENMDIEYKSCLAEAANKRKALLMHQGLKLAQQMREQETKAKAAYTKVLEGYIRSMSNNLAVMDTVQTKAKEDRDGCILWLKKIHMSITGLPIKAMDGLIETMELAEFNEFGKLNARYLKPPALGLSPKENEVLATLEESVLEIFRMKTTLMDLEDRVKNATFMIPTPYVSKADQIKAASKLPQTKDDMLYIETLQDKLLKNNKFLKQYSQDTSKLVLQRCNMSHPMTLAELALLYGPRQVETIRFGLLHGMKFNNIKASPSGSSLMPIFSVRSLSHQISKPSQNGNTKRKSLKMHSK